MKLKFFLIFLLILGMGVSYYYFRLFFQGYSDSLGNIEWSEISLWFLMLGISTQLMAHYIRAKKSQILLEVIRPVKTSVLFSGLAIGYLYNTVLPFRIGEFIRAHIVGRKMTISRSVVFFTILIERAVDGFILSFLVFLLTQIYFRGSPGISATCNMLAAIVLVASLIVVIIISMLSSQNKKMLLFFRWFTQLFNERIRDRMRFVLWSTIYGIHIIVRRADIKRYILLSLIMWVFYIGSMLFLVQGFFEGISLVRGILISSASYLSVSVPSGPAYLGTYHFYFSEIIGGIPGIQKGLIFSMSVISWAILMIPISLIGIMLLIMSYEKKKTNRVTSDAFSPMKNKLYREQDISQELSHFLDTYFSGVQVTHLLHSLEVRDDFKLVQTLRGGSNASTLLAWEGNKLLVKKITLPQYAEKLKAQYDWLVKRHHLKNIPTILGQKENEKYYSFDIAYEDKYITFFEFIHSESLKNSKQIIERIVRFVYQNIYELGERMHSEEHLNAYIKEKVINKTEDTAKLNALVASLLKYQEIIVNGEKYDNLNKIMKKIRNNKKIMKELSTFYNTPIHGDLTVDNIIVSKDNNGFLVLDPNNENYISDPIVDIGKLYQSVHSGYEFLCQLEKVEVKGNKINFEENISSKYSELFNHLEKIIKEKMTEEEHRAILFHEAVHYCRMLTYKANINPDTVPAFYAIAVRLLNQFYAQYNKG